jgi:hypothetical protein
MSRTLLLAAALTASTASAAVADDVVYRWKWDGAMQIVSESAECEGKFVSGDNARARFYPQLDSRLERSSFTRFAPFETELVKRTNDGPFQGTGQYYALKTKGGRVQVYYGTYNFTQTPAVISATTDFVTLVGTLEDYSDISGCTVTLRGTFVRVDADEEPPPYGY